MSDSEDGEGSKNGLYKNDNYSSPSKKKRKKGGKESSSDALRLVLVVDRDMVGDDGDGDNVDGVNDDVNGEDVDGEQLYKIGDLSDPGLRGKYQIFPPK